MAVRLLGVNLPNKKVRIALGYIYGIGITLGEKIAKECGIDPEVRIETLQDEELAKLRKHIDANYKVEGALRAEISSNIKELIGIGCYRGIRHRLGLPVRGQNTRRNARTRKGKIKNTVANKKKIVK